MNDQRILADAAIEAMLARRAGPGAPSGLAESIAAVVETLPDPRRRWWSIIEPSARWSPALRMAWMVAIAALLLAATASALYVGSQLLRRSEVTVVAPSVVLTLAHPGEVSAVAWSPDGTRLATASSAIEGGPGAVRIWDAVTGDELLQFTTGNSETSGVEMGFSADGTRLALGGPANAVYDASTGEELLGGLPDRFLAYSPDSRRMVVGGAWGWAAVVDANSGDELLDLRVCPGMHWVSAAAWSPDGTRFAKSCTPYLTVWDATTGAKVLALGFDVSNSWEDVEWSPDGTRIAAAGEDGTITIWDADSGAELATFAGRASVLSWSPDSSRIVTAGGDRSATIWDADSGAELAALTVDTGPVVDVAWSPDGTRIATASEDGTAKVWQLRRSQP